MSTLIYGVKGLLLPPVSLLLLAIGGLILHKRRLGRALLALGLLGLLLLSLPVVVGAWARQWERFSPLQADQVLSFNPGAVVVIGGGVDFGAPEYSTEATLNTRSLIRLRYAAKLIREFGLPVLVSGGRVSDSACESEAQLMADMLENEYQLPVTWQEGLSRNTAENARFSHAMLNRQGIDSIILVTQAYHMPRALHEFNKAGFKVLPAPTGFIGHDSEWSFKDFVPSSAAMMQSFLLAHEGLGVLWYAIRY